MFVVVYEPSTNEILYSRRIAPRETLDLKKFADKVASDYDQEIDVSDGHIPSCSGDIRVEFRPRRDDSTVIWSGQSYYFKT